LNPDDKKSEWWKMKINWQSTQKKYRKTKRSPRYTLEKTELIGLEAIQDLVELVLWTVYIIGERIVSLLLVGEPESGKTELMKKYRNNQGILVRRRFTAYGLLQDLINKRISMLFKRPKILGTIQVYEFSGMSTYKKNTADSNIIFLDAITEDGLSPESAYWISGDELEQYNGMKANLVAGINTFGFFTASRQVKANLYKGGWLSRNIPVTYSLSQQMSSKISDSIANHEYRFDKNFVDSIHLNFPKKRIDVILSERHSQEIKIIASEIAEGYNEELKPHKLQGFRLQKSLISLAKASALRNGRRIVMNRDIERIRYLSHWMNLKMNKLKVSYPFG